ncbi:MAG TPA: class I SAM-dependent methyltransferase [Rhabdochlamydiaceae bacterium]
MTSIIKNTSSACADQKISLDDFASLFDTTTSKLLPDWQELIEIFNSQYRIIQGNERDNIILDILRKIESPDLTRAGNESKARWQKDWNDQLEEFNDSGCAISTLTPMFLRRDRPIRFKGEYVKSDDPHFELAIYTLFRRWLFREYFYDPAITTIYEFGCGTGFNLAEIASLYPEKELHGLDWVPGPKEIIKLMQQRLGYNITGHIFNMLDPDNSFCLKPGSAVLVMGALEQLGTHFESFLQFILAQPLSLFVHVDSILEWYDENSLMDYLAIRFCKKRKYLEGYWPRIEQLENEGKIEILKKWRSPFGSFFLDSSSVIVWRPGGVK